MGLFSFSFNLSPTHFQQLSLEEKDRIIDVSVSGFVGSRIVNGAEIAVKISNFFVEVYYDKVKRDKVIAIELADDEKIFSEYGEECVLFNSGEIN